MFYHDKRTQFKVRVEKPNPAFARMLQQAIGGIEGEMRVCLQYLFQAWNSRGPAKYRDMLLDTGTEEISHIEMLATAVALNLEGAPLSVAEAAIKQDGIVGAVLGGMNPRSFLSAGLGAMAFDAEGVPFSGAYVVGSGNIMADMYTNVAAESTGRALATRLWEITDDPGMKDMLSFMIARDTMHQQQWLAVIEELGGAKGLPIPNSFPQSQENEKFSYAFISPGILDAADTPSGRWTHGPSIDGKGEFHVLKAEPYGDEPKLGPPVPEGHAQKEQMTVSDSIIGNIKDSLGI
jgi:Mn-containing catalase